MPILGKYMKKLSRIEFYNECFRNVDDGYLALCYKAGDGPLKSTFYHLNNLDKMLEHAEKLSGKFHVWANINPLKERPTTGRGKETDVKCICLFAPDIDAKDFISDPEEKQKAISEKDGYKWTDELLNECKNKILTHIKSICEEVDVLPSAIIDSGHGYYPIFFLNEPIEIQSDEHREELKAINERLHRTFDADATFDFARILRVPGTMNIKTGYPAPCELIEFNPERRYSIDDIQKFGGTTTTTTTATTTEKPTHVDDSRVEALLNTVSIETKYMIETGKVPDTCKISDKSRSGRDQCIVARLKSDSATYEQVKYIFKKYPCGDKYREPNNGDRYLKLCWDNSQRSKTNDKFFSPTSIAQTLCRQHNDTFAYVVEQDQFYQYKKGLWTMYTDGYMEKIIRDTLLDTNSEWDRTNKVNEVLNALKNLLTNEESARRFMTSDMNLDLINVKNGMLDWRTGELKSHDKEYYSTCQLNVNYDPEAESDLWKQCLKQWIPDQKSRMFIQEFSGYSLIPDTSQHRAVVLVGSGSNGKSVLLSTIEQLFGKDNLTNVPMQRLSDRFRLANIQHKLINICADISNSYIDQTEELKKIITGDSLNAEKKFKDSFEFTPFARLWFSCNEIPKASDSSDGWYRRFEYITFPNKFSEELGNLDRDLADKLKQHNNIAAVFNWALAGLRRLENQCKFTISDEMLEAKDEYRMENDNVTAFIDEMCVNSVNTAVPQAWLYQQYVDYCKETGTKPMSKSRFTKRVISEGYEKKRTSVHVCKLHGNFRCEARDDTGCLTCQDDDYIYKTSRCFIGIDINKLI